MMSTFLCQWARKALLFIRASFGSSYLIYGHLPVCQNERRPHSNASQYVRLYIRALLPLSLLLNRRMLNYKMIYVKELFMHTEFFGSCASKFSIYPFECQWIRRGTIIQLFFPIHYHGTHSCMLQRAKNVTSRYVPANN